MVKRTPKEFRDYNDYRDRGMMKWITAYAMDELVKGITKNKKEALKNNPTLPQMEPEEIDAKLIEAVQAKRPVSIQLNRKDEWGRQTDSIEGYFQGYLPSGKIRVNHTWLSLQDIRNINVIYNEKWFQVAPFKKSDTFQVAEVEVELVDDFSQDDAWIE